MWGWRLRIEPDVKWQERKLSETKAVYEMHRVNHCEYVGHQPQQIWSCRSGKNM